MSVDGATDDVWVGSVGQREIESVYRVQPGGDHGWNLKEGSFLYDTVTQTVCTGPDPEPDLVDPVGEYDHPPDDPDWSSMVHYFRIES